MHYFVFTHTHTYIYKYIYIYTNAYTYNIYIYIYIYIYQNYVPLKRPRLKIVGNCYIVFTSVLPIIHCATYIYIYVYIYMYIIDIRKITTTKIYFFKFPVNFLLQIFLRF